MWRQVRKLEDVLVKATDVKNVGELTKSKTKNEFKSDFRRMKSSYLRKVLEEHHIDVEKIWRVNSNCSNGL